jgi:choloylglycine hydrolase
MEVIRMIRYLRKFMVSFLLLVSIVCLIPQSSQGCTIFSIAKGDQVVVGFNLDWFVDELLFVVNKRNVSKTAYTGPELGNCKPAGWTSKYGSITYSQVGREIPYGGMNEAGLVVELLRSFFQTQYPSPDSRFCLLPTAWIQYQLDNFNRVEQVIASDSQVRIVSPPKPPAGIQYFVCDRTGNCAVIEFIDGKMVYFTKETMPAKVLSNESYKDHISVLNLYKDWGGDLPLPQSSGTYDRFVRAAGMVKNYNPETTKSASEYAFDVLNTVVVKSGFSTVWNIVFDIKNLRMYYHPVDRKRMRHFALSSFDFSCTTPVKLFLDVKADVSGDVTNNFVDYDSTLYRNILKDTFKVPDEILDGIVNYPDSTVCVDK